MNLGALWSELEGDATSGDGYVTRRVRPESDQDLRMAISRPDNQRVLLLRLTGSVLGEDLDLPRSRGFDVRVLDLADEPSSSHTVELRLTEPDYADVFDALVTDVVDTVSATTGDKQAVAALLERLRRWQRFLSSVPPDGLTPEQQRGLYGELWVLREQFMACLGASASLAAWVGPSRANQDFQWRGLAVEVKTSVTKQPQHIRIANERQLDGTGVERLILAHLSLDARRNSGETLPAAVEAARELARADSASTTLESLLFEVGYLDQHAHRYEDTGYELRADRLFDVSDGFPRIQESDLPEGVGDLSYSIELSACAEFEIEQAELQEEIARRRE